MSEVLRKLSKLSKKWTKLLKKLLGNGGNCKKKCSKYLEIIKIVKKWLKLVDYDRNYIKIWYKNTKNT